MSPRLARIGVDLVAGLVALSVGVALAGLTWRLAGDPGSRYGSAPVAARVARPIDVGAVVAAAPFGAGAPVSAAQAADQTLVLRGILLAEPREASTALIQVGGAPPVAFAIGQTVGAGVIDEIALDHVMLRAGGGQQLLAFPVKAGSTAPLSPPPPSSSPIAQSIAAPPPGASAGAPPAPSGFIASLGGSASGEGYRLGAQPPPAALLAGLQPGDVIEHVDGMSVSEITRDAGAYARAAADGSAQLDVMRGGRRLTLVVPLR